MVGVPERGWLGEQLSDDDSEVVRVVLWLKVDGGAIYHRTYFCQVLCDHTSLRSGKISTKVDEKVISFRIGKMGIYFLYISL